MIDERRHHRAHDPVRLARVDQSLRQAQHAGNLVRLADVEVLLVVRRGVVDGRNAVPVRVADVPVVEDGVLRARQQPGRAPRAQHARGALLLAAAGVLAGDQLIAINGEESLYFSDYVNTLQSLAGQEIRLSVLRGLDTLHFDMLLGENVSDEEVANAIDDDGKIMV